MSAFTAGQVDDGLHVFLAFSPITTFRDFQRGTGYGRKKPGKGKLFLFFQSKRRRRSALYSHCRLYAPPQGERESEREKTMAGLLTANAVFLGAPIRPAAKVRA